MTSARHPPAFERTTNLVARALSMDAAELETGLRRAIAADLPNVVAFRKENFDELIEGDDHAYLQWRYRFGSATRGIGELWVLHCGDALIGIVGTEDIVCHQHGHRYQGVRTMDILVDRKVQSSGLGVWLNQAVFRTTAFAMAVGANRNSAGTVNRLFHAMPSLTEWRLLIDTRAFVRKRIPVAMVAAPVSALFSLMLRLARGLSTLLLSDRAIEIRPITRFDESVASLYEAGPETRATIQRSATFLNYRLFENPRGNYFAAGAYRDGVLQGFIAWRLAGHAREVRWAHIIDLRAAGAHQDAVLRALLLHVGREAENAGCQHASLVMLAVAPSAVLWSTGFLAARHNQKVFGLHAEDRATFEALAGAQWSLTDLCDDNDGS